MGGALVGLFWVAATSSVALSSSVADDLGDLPLSDEELALLDTLATATTTPELRARPYQAPEPLGGRRLERARLLEPAARSVLDALGSLPTLGWSLRGAERATVIYEGLEMAPLQSGPANNGWLGLDPRFLDGVRLGRPASLVDTAQTARGRIELLGRGADPGSGFQSEASLQARSADRASRLFGSVAGDLGPVGGRVSLAYLDTGPLRVAPTLDEDTRYGPSQRWNGAARLRLFGREEDRFRITLGGDLDRLQNQTLYDSSGRRMGRDELSQRHLAFLRIDWRTEGGETQIVAAEQGLRRQRTEDNGTRLDRADQLQARASGRYQLISDLSLATGGIITTSESRGYDWQGTAERAEGYLGLAWMGSALQAQLSGRLVRRAVELNGLPEVSSLRILGEATLQVAVAGPLSIAAAIRQHNQLPAPERWRLFRDQPETLQDEVGWTAEFGPQLRSDDLWLDLNVFIQERSRAFEPELNDTRLLNLSSLGLELEGAYHFGPGWSLAGALAYAEIKGPNDRAVERLPSLEGLLSLRHDFVARGAFLEAHARIGSSGLYLRTTEPNFEPDPFLRIGLEGGVDLGLGLRLNLAVENALDRPVQLPDSMVPSSGIDLGAVLSWSGP